MKTTNKSKKHYFLYAIVLFVFCLVFSTSERNQAKTETPPSLEGRSVSFATAANRESHTETTGKTVATLLPQKEPGDERVPHFVQKEAPDYKTRSVQWTSPIDGSKWTQEIVVDRHAYDYFRKLPRYLEFSDFQKYLDDSYNRKLLAGYASSFLSFAQEQGYSSDRLIREVIAFVQAIPYAYDILSTGQKEFPKYPLETLFDGEGDCEDSSLLLAGILRELGCKVCLLSLPDHCAVGILDYGSCTGSYYEYQGRRYFLIETTASGWNIGDMPEAFDGAAATICEID